MTNPASPEDRPRSDRGGDGPCAVITPHDDLEVAAPVMAPGQRAAILSALRAGRACDDDLLALAAWASSDAARRNWLRLHWPTEQGAVVHQFFCVKRLGDGSTGAVYKALAVGPTPRLVALKLLHPTSNEEEERFREREIAILKALQCESTAGYLGCGTIGGTPYLVTELAHGDPLDTYLHKYCRSLREQLAVFKRVCEAVAGLHAEGVIHRDLKPKHILIDRDGEPRIVDLGLSAVRTDDWPTRVKRARTEIGHILGTVKYMSPEQSWGSLLPVDQRTDVWALGIMLHEIVTDGTHPFGLHRGEIADQDEMMRHIQTGIPERPQIQDAQFAVKLERLIMRCLAQDPERRPVSAALLALDLDACLRGEQIKTRQLPLSYRVRRRIRRVTTYRPGWSRAVLATAVTSILLLAAALLGMRTRGQGDAYGVDSRAALQALAADVGSDGVRIVGVDETSIAMVPALAKAAGLEGVTEDLRTWRGVHGLLMQRFADAGPKAVAWDYAFRSQQADDENFAVGAKAMQAVGIPVVVAAMRYDESGQPELSGTIMKALQPLVRHGVIIAIDTVVREGEVVMALRRGDRVVPSLVLSTFAAVVHPECRVKIDWQDTADDLRLVYAPVAPDAEIPMVDRVSLTGVIHNPRARLAAQPGDQLACRGFTLHRPEYWNERVIAYHDLLSMPRDELRQRVGNRVLLVGDLRKPTGWFQGDRHPVRYGTAVVGNVPGCFILADAINGMIANRYLASPIHSGAFAGIGLLAFCATCVPARLKVGQRFRQRWVRRSLLIGLGLAGVACLAAAMILRQPGVLFAVFGGCAVTWGLAGAAGMEFLRYAHRSEIRPAGTLACQLPPSAVTHGMM